VTIQHSSLPVSASPIFRGASIEDLNHIKHPDIDMVICEREMPSVIERALGELSGIIVENKRFHLEVSDVRASMLAVFQDWEF